MEDFRPKLVRTGVIVLGCILLAIPTVLYVGIINAKPVRRRPTVFIPLTPTPRLTQNDSVHHVLKTKEGVITYYWLYGKIVSIDEEDAIGLHMTFTLDGDPYGNRLSVVLIPAGRGYRLYEYSKNFGTNVAQEIITSQAIQRAIIDSKKLVEVRIPFGGNPGEDKITLALEGANSGLWQNLPVGTILYGESIGIVSGSQ